jgi:hypothetical protein
MFDTPIDAWYVWLGLSAASLAVLGVATSLPAAPAPDAAGAAETVDRIAAAEYEATATRALRAREIRLGSRRIGLRSEVGTAHATFAFRIVPVDGAARLDRLLHGAPPRGVFASRAAFERAVVAARQSEAGTRWRPAGRALVVRRLSWAGVDVTLVGTVSDDPGSVTR